MRWWNPVAIVRESFRAKIFALLILVIAILSSSFTASYVLHEKNALTEKLLTEGNLLANLLAYNARLPVFAENIPMLSDAMNGLMEREQVLAVSVYNEEGKLLAEKLKPEKGGRTGGSIAPREGRGITSTRHTQAEESIDFFAPVVTGIGTNTGGHLLFEENPRRNISRTIGLVRVVIDKREANRRVSTLLIVSLLSSALFLLLGSAAAYMVARGVTRPLNLLAAGVRSLEKGDLSARINVVSKDEIGRLALAFNTMVATLARREGENRALHEALRLAQKKEAKEEWERTFDTVPDLIAILDREQRIVRINRAMAERLAISKEEAEGKGCFALFHGSEEAGAACLHAKLLADGLGHEKEIYEKNLDSYFWVTVSPLRKGNGELIGSVHVARDISERKRAEEEKRLIHAKLIQANKMTSLGLLVSGMAHEVNNPNNNIMLAAHILAKSWEDIGPILDDYHRNAGDFTVGGHPFSQMRESLPSYITGIRENARRIEGIIRNLRDFVRKGKANISSLTDVNMIVTVSAAILNHQIKKHTAHFSLHLSEGIPRVRGNPQLLEQVVINLIMNAVQALPDTTRSVTVSTSFDSSAGEVIVTVRDEGCGMPPEVRQRIFEPFFSTKLDSGGTGLGLAISNVIVGEHCGHLDFDSVEGAGTTAAMRLPAVNVPAGEETSLSFQ